MASTFTRVPREELERMAREQYARVYRDGRSDRPKPERPRNVRASLLVFGADKVEVPFHGRMYELTPVSFEDGMRLSDVRATIEELEDAEPTRENARRYLDACRLVVRLAPRYMLPRGRLRRALWRLRLRRNPFRQASEREVGELLGFFLGCRMMSRVRHPGG